MKTLNEIINDLVVAVFAKHKVNADKITVDDFDLDRVYINNDEYILRMWSINGDGNVEYTLYKTVGNSALRVGAGKVRSSRRLVRLLQEDAEQKYLEYEKSIQNKE